jgi:hypothetical protein
MNQGYDRASCDQKLPIEKIFNKYLDLKALYLRRRVPQGVCEKWNYHDLYDDWSNMAEEVERFDQVVKEWDSLISLNWAPSKEESTLYEDRVGQNYVTQTKALW